jgi:glycosyltransferase involved in cell wall biosynthesis
MKILIDCRCLNYSFFTGINSYTIRVLDCLRIIKSERNATGLDLEIVSLGLKTGRLQELSTQFEFLEKLFDRNTSLPQYHQIYTNPKFSDTLHRAIEAKISFTNLFRPNLDNSSLEFFDFVVLPQPRLLNLHPESKLIAIFHDVYSILNNEIQFPQSLIFSRRTCQTLVNRSQKVVVGSISTCLDIDKLFFAKQPEINILSKVPNFCNPKIQLIYPALPKLDELQTKTKTKQVNSTNLEILPPYILAISGIEPRKNWQNLLLAHHSLKQNPKLNYNNTLVLAGAIVNPKYYQKLIKLIRALNIQNVQWQINPTESQKTQLIANAEFLVYPSLYEGFGFPILEAFEYNKTILTSRISSMPEIGKNACMYINPFNPHSIASGIWILITDTKYKQNLVDNIRINKAQYSWTQMTKSLDKILK